MKINENESNLKPGDNYYTAYVGPPLEYDFMGATQFRLLCTLGLRHWHKVLDFGCGSLRAGKFLISYLDRNSYYGVEPNKWLIDDAINNEVGKDLIAIKQPSFYHNDDFSLNNIHCKFDYIVAQSIFSHTGSNLVRKCLDNFADKIKDDGIIVATFIEGSKNPPDINKWYYPDCITFHQSLIKEMARNSGFHIRRLPWFHPRQSWYILSKNYRKIPTSSMNKYLHGAVLFSKELNMSNIYQFKKTLKALLPEPIEKYLRALLKHTK